MVSLAILAVSLTAIAGISGGGFAASEYAKNVTIATLLARSKMIDIEEEMVEEDFPEDDKEWDGDFEDEGRPGFRWKAIAREIDVDVGQMVGSMLGADLETENVGDRVAEYIGAMSGTSGDSELDSKVADSPIAEYLKGDVLEGLFKQVGETLGDAIREVELEITWGVEGVSLESVTFVKYVVKGGTLKMPTGNIRLPAVAGKKLPGQGGQQAPPPGSGFTGGTKTGGGVSGSGFEGSPEDRGSK